MFYRVVCKVRPHRPFFREFRVVSWGHGWKWYPAESTICNDRISLTGVAGCLEGRYKAPSGSRAEPWLGFRGEDPGSSSNPAVHSTKRSRQKMHPKSHFLGTFLSVCCIQIERKNSFKLKKLCARQIIQPYARWTSQRASHGNTKAQTA